MKPARKASEQIPALIERIENLEVARNMMDKTEIKIKIDLCIQGLTHATYSNLTNEERKGALDTVLSQLHSINLSLDEDKDQDE